MIMTEFSMKEDKFALIIGIGGAGGNILSHLYDRLLNEAGIDYLALNTDMQALNNLKLPVLNKYLIGERHTQGSGAGADPEKGRKAAIESRHLIQTIIKSNRYHIVFIIAGMGGGTGTGASPVVAELCRSMNLYTFAICSTPFSFEGTLRQRQATEGIARLKPFVNNIAIFSNDNIINSLESVTFSDAFKISDRYFSIPIKTLLSILQSQGVINIDFADIITTLKGGKIATIAYGMGQGENRITKAFEDLKNSPFFNSLLLTKAQSILVYLTYKDDIQMHEVNELSTILSQFNDQTEIIWGIAKDPELVPNVVRISAIITNITSDEEIVNYIDPKELSIEKQFPKEIEQEVRQIKKDFDGKRIAFLIMQFGDSRFHNEIYETIQKILLKKNIVTIRADYKEYHSDLYYNILSYIYAADFGIAVFERIDDDLFNPNVAFEVGFMFALNKKVCLLKEKSMKSLPTDIIGKLYKIFDLNNLEKSLEKSLYKWIDDKINR